MLAAPPQAVLTGGRGRKGGARPRKLQVESWYRAAQQLKDVIDSVYKIETSGDAASQAVRSFLRRNGNAVTTIVNGVYYFSDPAGRKSRTAEDDFLTKDPYFYLNRIHELLVIHLHTKK